MTPRDLAKSATENCVAESLDGLFSQDLRGSVCKLAEHVGKNLSDDVIDGIVERVTFGAMQRTYKELEEMGGKEGKLMARFKGSPFIRKGKAMVHKNYLENV